MSSILSRGCEYALQAVLFLASRPEDKPVLLREISDTLKIPPHFLGKILQQLRRNHLVLSRKGRNGGFVLGRSAQDISLQDIIVIFDGPAFLDSCILGFPVCSNETPCPVHQHWGEVKQLILEMLQRYSIEQLGRQMTEINVSSPLDALISGDGLRSD